MRQKRVSTDPAGGAYSAPPDPLAGFRGGGQGKDQGREGKGEGRSTPRAKILATALHWMKTMATKTIVK